MPGTLVIFTDDEIKIRHREPYFPAGLNEKMGVSTARGTYRGYDLQSNLAADNTVTVAAHAVSGDHTLVYRDSAGIALTIRREDDFDIDLSALVDVSEKTWVLAMYATYAVGATSTAEIRAYELAPTDEFTIAAEYPELVVLGAVVIPASSAAPLPVDNVTPRYRTSAWITQPVDAVIWTPNLYNGSFTQPGVNNHVPFWNYNDLVPVACKFSPSSSEEDAGALLTDTSLGALSTLDVEIAQTIGTELSGDNLRVTLSKKVLVAPTSTSGILLKVYFRGQSDPGNITYTIPASTVDSDFVDYDYLISVADLMTPDELTHLDRVEIRVFGDYSNMSTGVEALLVRNVQIWTEPVATPAKGFGVMEGSILVLHGPESGDAEADAETPRIMTENDYGQPQHSQDWEYLNTDGIGTRQYKYSTSGPSRMAINARFVHDLSHDWVTEDINLPSWSYRMCYDPVSFDTRNNDAQWDNISWTSIFQPTSANFDITNAFEGETAWGWNEDPMIRSGRAFNISNYYVDHLGMEPGQLISFREDWYNTPGSGNSRWGELGTNPTVAISTSYWKGMELRQTVGSAGLSAVYSPDLFNWEIGLNDPSGQLLLSLRWQQVIVQENTDNGFTMQMGINDAIDYDGGYGYWLERGLDDNWSFISGYTHGSKTTTDIGILPQIGQVYSYRLDFMGDEQPEGHKAMLWVDGVLVATHTTNQVLVSSQPTVTFHINNGIGGNTTVYTGPVSLQYYLPFVNNESWSSGTGDY